MDQNLDLPKAAKSKQIDKHKSLKKKFIRNIIANVFCVVLALVAMLWMGHFFLLYTEHEITNDAVVEQYLIPISSRIPGYIKDIRFTEFQYVTQGDTLIIIDDSEYKIKLMDAKASLMDAEGVANTLSSTVQASQDLVAVSDANLEEMKAKLWKAKQYYERSATLFQKGSVSKQEYEQMKSDYEALRASYNSLQHQRHSKISQSEEAGKRIMSAAANILRKQADVEMAKLNLSYTVITAPYSGYMGRSSLGIDQLIQAGQTLSNLVKGDAKWVIANYKETQIANIYIGQPVEICVDAIKGKSFLGKVTAISDATGSKYSLIPTDNAAGNFVKVQQRIPVRIDFDSLSLEDANQIRAGLMVETRAKIH